MYLTHNFLELIAAFSGFYYLSRNKTSKLRHFVYFLVLTVCVDALGLYTLFESIRPPKDSIWHMNSWLYNSFIMGSLFFYLSFYKSILTHQKFKKILSLLILISVVIVIVNVFNAGSNFFKTNITYNFIWTTFSVFICVSFYFYELLLSDRILVFYKSSLFYISIGLLIWWLILPPLEFYMPYYKKIYPEVVGMKKMIILLTNIYLYSCYTIGFLWGKEK